MAFLPYAETTLKIATIDARRQPEYFPYYKPQWYDTKAKAWREIQRRCDSPEEALVVATHLAPLGVQVRAIEVTRTIRHPVS